MLTLLPTCGEIWTGILTSLMREPSSGARRHLKPGDAPVRLPPVARPGSRLDSHLDRLASRLAHATLSTRMPGRGYLHGERFVASDAEPAEALVYDRARGKASLVCGSASLGNVLLRLAHLASGYKNSAREKGRLTHRKDAVWQP